MFIFVLAAIAACVSALAGVILVVLNISDRLGSSQKKRERHSELHHPPSTEGQLHPQEQSQGRREEETSEQL